MTITYKADTERGSVARFVPTDWKALRRILRKSQPEIYQQPWMRVMELTQKRTPHHHLVMGVPSGFRVKCWQGKKPSTSGYEAGRASCDCLAHRVSRAWLAVTGDSYWVHTSPVIGPAGAASYMSKYMAKGFLDPADTGMSRRWSSSKNWMGAGRVRMAGSAVKAWAAITLVPGRHLDDQFLAMVNAGKEALTTQVGENLTMVVRKRVATGHAVRRMETQLAKAYSSPV